MATSTDIPVPQRIAARVELHPNRIFPTDELLDHVPILMDRIADYLEDPGEEIAADAPVAGKAIEYENGEERLLYSGKPTG